MNRPHASGAAWYVAYCQPSKERIVGSLLSSQIGLPVYLPEIISRRAGRECVAAFFPRYLFVCADLQLVSLDRLNTVQGMLGLVSFGDGPLPLAEAVVEQLRERVEHLNAQRSGQDSPLSPGDAVRIRHGPLQGMEALFIGSMAACDRVRVLIEFLGEQRVVEIEAHALAHSVIQRRTRRTRGRGRPIRIS